eukprot:5189991-Prymnesium_polylepis.1
MRRPQLSSEHTVRHFKVDRVHHEDDIGLRAATAICGWMEYFHHFDLPPAAIVPEISSRARRERCRPRHMLFRCVRRREWQWTQQPCGLGCSIERRPPVRAALLDVGIVAIVALVKLRVAHDTPVGILVLDDFRVEPRALHPVVRLQHLHPGADRPLRLQSTKCRLLLRLPLLVPLLHLRLPLATPLAQAPRPAGPQLLHTDSIQSLVLGHRRDQSH